MIRKIKDSEPKLFAWNRDFPEGRLEVPLKNKKFTVINYYNNPHKAIPIEQHKYEDRHTYYLHPVLPAYLIYYKNNQYIGTFEEIKDLINNPHSTP